MLCLMRVPPVHQDETKGTARELLAEYESKHGKRPALWEALANHPPLLEAHAQFYETTILGGNLDQELKELVGVVVSATNECDFCVSSHTVNLTDLFGYEGEKVDSITSGNFEEFTHRERVALEFAQAVAEDPQKIIDADVTELRDVGFTDQDIVELLGAIAQFVAANIYADTLAISPDVYEE